MSGPRMFGRVDGASGIADESSSVITFDPCMSGLNCLLIEDGLAASSTEADGVGMQD